MLKSVAAERIDGRTDRLHLTLRHRANRVVYAQFQSVLVMLQAAFIALSRLLQDVDIVTWGEYAVLSPPNRRGEDRPRDQCRRARLLLSGSGRPIRLQIATAQREYRSRMERPDALLKPSSASRQATRDLSQILLIF